MDEDILAEKKFSVDKELDSIIDSLKDSGKDIITVLKLCIEFKKTLDKGTKEKLFAWDRLLRDYKFLEEDIDVNGERVKKITRALIEQAQQIGMDKEKLKEFKTKESWSFDW